MWMAINIGFEWCVKDCGCDLGADCTKELVSSEVVFCYKVYHLKWLYTDLFFFFSQPSAHWEVTEFHQ